ncbi:OsmC family protein [Actinokineospora spheciospongiae]|uniref:OsmC family protein n=1 Tax=Actinokineospora spheciospongiae TaxID=909613 RepID=UPI000D71A62F|nr:OsmC family protein [Actinokineospora spheciospongiae]PWW67130.1 organic hydroperoxide reductase OsmC/OhrA [Actinokineospora spheciospongiae]
MSRQHDYRVTVRWSGDTGAGYRDYVRDHDVVVEGKPVLKGSADPAFRGTSERWNPEELLVASLSECHMLTFLSLCARAGVVVTGYVDAATGAMREEPGNSGRFTEVVLRPEVTVADPAMVERAEALHERAHDTCFIANSVNFPVRHEPTTTSS